MEFKKVNIASLILGLLILFSIELKSQGVPNYVPSSGLVGWWPFTGNAIDSSGNGNNLTVNGASLINDRFSKSNSAYGLPLLNDNLSKTNAQPSFDNYKLSVSLWMKFPTQYNASSISLVKNGTLYSNGFAVAIDQNNGAYGTNNYAVIFMVGNGTAVTFLSNQTELGQWANIVSTYDGSNIRIYLNGNLKATQACTISMNTPNNDLLFGVWDNLTPPSVRTRYLDDVGIWKRALTDCEIKQLYLSQYHSAPTLNIGNDTIRVCKADSLKLTANNGFASYSWSTGATSKSIYKKTNGKVVVTATDSFGCSAKDSAIVSILNPKIAPRDTVVCKGSQLTLRSSINNNSSSNSTSSYMPNALKTGLIGWYPFSGNANDSSGNGNNGTVNGATLTTDRFGRTNSAYEFNYNNVRFGQQNQEIYIPYNSILNVSNITLSYWVYARQYYWSGNPNASVNIARFQYGYSNPNGQVWGVAYTDKEILGWLNGTNGTSSYFVRDSTAIKLNSWNNIVMTYNGAVLKLYMNSVLIGTLNYTSALNTGGTSGISIGENNSANGFWQHTDGKIDDFGMWNRALSASEISQIYTLQSSPIKLTWSTSDTTSTTKITPTANTKVWLKATDGIGTCYDTTNVIVRSKTLDIGKDTIRSCKLDSLQLSGSNGFVSYAWSNGASSKSTYLKSTGKVVLTATDSFGCKAKDSAIVSILNPKIAPRDTVVCKGSQITMRSTINNNSSINTTCGFMPNALKTGLVGWYPFCGNANDGSGNGNNLTNNGASLVKDRFGNINSAYYYNGTSYMDKANPSFTLNPNNSHTFSAWVKAKTYSNSLWSAILTSGNIASGNFVTSLAFNPTGTNLVYGQAVQQSSWTDLTYSTNKDTNYMHVVAVYNSYTMYLYLNGSLVNTMTYNQVGNPLNMPIQIGADHAKNQKINGILDDIGIWTRALSSTEVRQLYNIQSVSSKLTWSTSDTTSTTKITANANTKVWLKATDGIGTCYDTTNVLVSNPQLNVVNDTLKFTACNRDSMRLNVGSKWSSTQWSNGSKDSIVYLKTTGKYKVTVKDQYGCSASDSTYFINPGKPKINTLLADSVNCFAGNDGSITSTYSGGFTPYTFLWNDASKQTSANAYNLSKGAYKLVLKDAYGCKDSLTANVYEPLKLSSSISFNDSVNCYGGSDGSLQVNVSGGVKNYKYLWNDANKQKTAKASNLKQGSYKVLISDYYNCKDSTTAVVSEPAKLQASLVYADSVNCFGGNDGSIKINVVGGVKNYKFLWSDNQTTQNASNLKKGTYKVMVSDFYNCKDSISAVVNEPLKLQVSLLSNDSVNCFGGSDGNLKINVAGGVKNYKFLWSNSQTTQDASSLKKGTYKVMVSDYYICKDSLSSVIEEPAKLQVSLVSTDSVNCYAGNDGSIKINVVGGVKNYTFLWSDNQTTQNASSLKKGLYKVMVNDYYQCKDSLSASIYEPAKLTVGLMSVDSVNCFSGSDGSIQVNVSGGVKNYKTVWNDPGKQNTLKASNLKKGTYKVMVSDYYNCKDSLTVKVDEPAKLTASIVLVDSVNCFGGKDGKIQVNVSGGVRNYNYIWNDAAKQKTALASNLQKGTYKVLVSDYYACKDSATASVLEPNKLVASINYVDSVNCFGGSDGSITTNISGGVKIYKYLWSDNQKTQNAYNLKKGTYKLTVSDYYNCKDSVTATVYEPLKLVVSVVSTDSVNCFGGNDGSIRVKVAGGNNGYTYLWNDINKQKTPLASNLSKGLYRVSVKDIYGCADSLTANVYEPAKVVLKIQSFKNASCFGYSNGSAIAGASGGTGGFRYTWNTAPVQTGTSAIGLRKGTYRATVVDAYGCSDTASVVIAEPQQIVPKISANRLAVRDILHELSSTVTPAQKYTYNWTPSSVFGKQSNAAVINGKFYTTTLVTLRTTDATGCFGEDTATITVFIPFSDFIPTVFSPNGDSHNDVFGLPDYFEVEQFDVYNRWGALLFRGSASNPTWDGIYEGKLVPVGTYMYIIKAKLKNTVYEFEHQGTVTVLR